jgi:hypothetical protein
MATCHGGRCSLRGALAHRGLLRGVRIIGLLGPVLAVGLVAGAPSALGAVIDQTSTSVVCSPSSVHVGSATLCTATVTDTASSGATTPTGTVFFGSPISGSFGSSTASCALSGTGTTGVASCSLSFTPSAAGSYTVDGGYSGDGSHRGSAGQSGTLTAVIDQTSTSVACSPSSVLVGSATLCTATVTDTASSGATTPTGRVYFGSPIAGSFGSPGYCTLSGTGTTGVASCSLSFTPSASGSYWVNGVYGGDSSHYLSNGQSATLTAIAHPTSTTVVCSPSSFFFWG